ncbi:MAG: sugar transferase [Eubacteriales bacterium]
MKNFKTKTRTLITVILDILLIIVTYYLAIYIKYGQVSMAHSATKYLTSFLPILAILMLLLMHTYDMYKEVNYRQPTDIIVTNILIIIIGTTLSVPIASFIDPKIVPRSILLIAAPIHLILLSLWRILKWKIGQLDNNKIEVLVFDDLEKGQQLLKKMILQQGHIFKIKYIYDINQGLDNVDALIKNYDYIIVGANVNQNDAEMITTYCIKYNKSICIVPDLYNININRSQLIQIDDVPMLNIAQFGLSFEERLLKRFFDLVISGLGIILLSPIILLIALSIKLTSKGPVLYKQIRITIDNKRYYIYKFRTMIENAEEKTGPILAKKKDPRITNIGRLLRATRLDEIPQLFNVFIGQMSIIGPRPERPCFIDEYVNKTHEYAYRTVVKAGITGLAQVLGKYTTDYEDKLKYDLMYIKNYSFMLDLKILLKTLKVIITKDSSEGIQEDISLEDLLRINDIMMIETIEGIHLFYNERELEVYSKENKYNHKKEVS